MLIMINRIKITIVILIFNYITHNLFLKILIQPAMTLLNVTHQAITTITPARQCLLVPQKNRQKVARSLTEKYQ